MEHQKLLDSTDNGEAKNEKLFYTDRPRDESKEHLTSEIKQSNKKKYLYWGIGGAVLIGVIALIVVLALKKDDPKPDPTPPSPPDPDIPHFNPYEVYQSDPANMAYKLRINPNLQFKFPYNETANNIRYTDISLNGNSSYQSGKTLRFTFSGARSASALMKDALDHAPRVHKKKKQ